MNEHAHLAISGSDACVNPRILCWVSWRKWVVLVRTSSPSGQMFHFSYQAEKRKDVKSSVYNVLLFKKKNHYCGAVIKTLE